MTDVLADWLATPRPAARHWPAADDAVRDFLDHRPGDGKTAEEFTALLAEQDAHRENQRREERAA